VSSQSATDAQELQAEVKASASGGNSHITEIKKTKSNRSKQLKINKRKRWLETKRVGGQIQQQEDDD